MQVETENKEILQLPLIGHVIFGSDDTCGYVLKKSTGQPKKSCSLINDKSVCILEVFENGNVSVNNRKITETAILHPGDTLSIEQQFFKLVDENKLPKECKLPFSVQSGDKGTLITSVSGLRSYNRKDYGKLQIVGNKNSYSHKPINNQDIPFYVSYIQNNLAILCKKGEKLEINGNSCNYALLDNGDYISTGEARYCVESPGTSSFSKYSPSHPRNIQLSEEYTLSNSENGAPEINNNFLKNNLWWIVLLAGLISISVLIFILKQS